MTHPLPTRASSQMLPDLAGPADEGGFAGKAFGGSSLGGSAFSRPTLRQPTWADVALWATLLAGLACGGAAAVAQSLTAAALAGALCGGAALAFILAPTLREARAQAAAARHQAEAAELARARSEAQSTAKSQFLAEMSHELRTPLNAVIGFSEMMAQEVLGPHAVPAYGGYARDIHASGRHLLALADDILDLARIETGHRTLLETAIGLDSLLGDCAHMMRLSAAERAVSLDPPPATDLRIWGDERALRQMVLNLLANAVKFTPAGGTVRLSARLDGAGAPVIAVEDTGPGLGEQQLPFDLSARHRQSSVDPATGRGAGLGLIIVAALAHLHGADLRLASRPGGGTEALLAFPVARRLR